MRGCQRLPVWGPFRLASRFMAKRKTPSVPGKHKFKGYLLREKLSGQLDRARAAAAKVPMDLVDWIWKAVEEKIDREK